jgi:hypothetical protein
MSKVLNDDGDDWFFVRLGDTGGLVRDCAKREAFGNCVGDADDVLAPGVENRGAVSSRGAPTVLEEEESRLRSSSVLKVPSTVDIEPLGREVCGVHAVPFSTHGAGSDDVGGREASDCTVDSAVDPSSRLTLFIVKILRQGLFQEVWAAERDGSESEISPNL